MIDVSLAPKPDDVALFTPNRSFQKGKSVSPPPSAKKKVHHHNTYNVAGSGYTGSGRRMMISTLFVLPMVLRDASSMLVYLLLRGFGGRAASAPSRALHEAKPGEALLLACGSGAPSSGRYIAQVDLLHVVLLGLGSCGTASGQDDRSKSQRPRRAV